jgi:ABC-2 type transport system permease protein
MSAVELQAGPNGAEPAGTQGSAGAGGSAGIGASAAVQVPALIDLRLFRSELGLIFGRRRNWAGMAVLAAVPILIAVVIKSTSGPRRGDGPDFFTSITSNGLFVALAALTIELPLFLPLAVAAISGDSIAGEANLGTLRYLLTVPVHRTRLLVTKLAGLVVFAAAATVLVAGVGAGIGLALFGGGPLTTLSGTQLAFGAGVWRLVLVCGYLTGCLAALAAVGLFVSTLTEQPIGATIATVGLAVTSQILDSIPQLHAIQPYLLTHNWFGFGDLLRDPMATNTISKGLISAAVYLVVFGTAAWARFGGKDVSS